MRAALQLAVIQLKKLKKPLFTGCSQQVVCSGFLDLILDTFEDVKLGISVLRCLRLLRVFKVTR